MGYMHIENLYRPAAQRVLAFKQVYCLEKIHGTSAHLSFDRSRGAGKVLSIFSGGENHTRFSALFDLPALLQVFDSQFVEAKALTLYGEAYGGRQQGMRETYGEVLRFIVFDVKVNGSWLSVPDAEKVARSFGLEFVDYALVSADLEEVNAQRDRPSVQAARNGITAPKKREGVVLRPPFEVILNDGSRCMAKHKNPEFSETATPREVSPEMAKVLEDANAVATEWVTSMRLTHVLDKLGNPTDHASIPRVIDAVIEDVLREGAGEVLDTKDNRKAIGRATVSLFKSRIEKVITEPCH